MEEATRVFGKLDVVRQQLKLAAEAIARREAEMLVAHVEATLDTEWGPPLESPLEAIFWIWWMSMRDCMDPCFVLDVQREVVVDGQVFRLDFVVDLKGEDVMTAAWKPIAIEVDGHAFHEKTQEQVASRNQRDRLLQQAGWTVLHFSWSELTTRAEDCVAEVLIVARQHYSVALRQITRTE